MVNHGQLRQWDPAEVRRTAKPCMDTPTDQGREGTAKANVKGVIYMYPKEHPQKQGFGSGPQTLVN